MKTNLLTYLLILLCIAFNLTACRDDNELEMDKEVNQLFRSGLEYSEEGGTFEFSFIKSRPEWETTFITYASTEENWCEYESTTDGDLCTVFLFFKKNETLSERHGELTIKCGKDERVMKVRQRCGKQILLDKSHYTVAAEGGDIDIKFYTNTDYTYHFSFYQPEWLTVVGSEVSDEQVIFHLRANKNEGYGRIATVSFSYDGAEKDKRILVQQEARPFTATENITTLYSGQLSVMLGNDVENWSRIENLTLSGPLNGNDCGIIRAMLSNDTNYKKYSINLKHLDLSHATIFSGDKSYYESVNTLSEWKQVTKTFITQNNAIPDYMFDGAKSLESIKLPRTTSSIGKYAFRHCNKLEEIQIPSEVETIAYGVFQFCENMKQIDISEDSWLKALGSYAFDTGSILEHIFIPKTLKYLEEGSFYGLHAKEVHLRWETPPTVRVIPAVKDATLYVPTGCAEAYKAMKTWGRFERIVEEYIKE